MSFKFNDSKNQLSQLGNKLSNMGEKGIDSMLGELFPSTDRKITSGEFFKIQECAGMLERYVDKFPREGCVSFQGVDMNRWKEDYYNNLVHGGPELPDDQFYTGRADTRSHLGIGTDGEFTGEELFQFLYRLYKAIVSCKLKPTDMSSMYNNAQLIACARMLEKYVDNFPKTKENVTFKGQDMEDWKKTYYPDLVLSEPHLLDNRFFNSHSDSSNYGIGADGEFSAYELFQFMYRLYKELANQLG